MILNKTSNKVSRYQVFTVYCCYIPFCWWTFFSLYYLQWSPVIFWTSQAPFWGRERQFLLFFLPLTLSTLQQLNLLQISEQDFSLSETCVSGHKNNLVIWQKVSSLACRRLNQWMLLWRVGVSSRLHHCHCSHVIGCQLRWSSGPISKLGSSMNYLHAKTCW